MEPPLDGGTQEGFIVGHELSSAYLFDGAGRPFCVCHGRARISGMLKENDACANIYSISGGSQWW